MKIRTFTALELPMSLRQELSGQANFIAGQGKRQRIRWMPPEKYHLTLTFLGDVDSARLSELQFAMERKLELTGMVPCKISTITPFPFTQSPKNVAALVEPTDELLKLQIDVANCARNCGIMLERRRFVPHVTLGRLKARDGKAVNFQPSAIFLEGVVGAVTLYQSELTPEGAVHSPLAEIPLRSSTE